MFSTGMGMGVLVCKRLLLAANCNQSHHSLKVESSYTPVIARMTYWVQAAGGRPPAPH